jgi:SAM-dependent methyltransferase
MSVSTSAPAACVACGEQVTDGGTVVRGYRDGSSFLVRACAGCGTSFADAAGTDLGALYKAIYEHAERLPGYSRYAAYAAGAQVARDPLAYLAEREASYRAIARVLETLPASGRRVLEVGSGLGYLTYALRKRGYDAVGLDLSSSAVAGAVERFGPWFECTTLEERARRSAERFDVIVMTELIEHVTDPLAVLRDARALLAPGGRIVVTTPNRSAYPDAAVWRTEHPPVHLVWFSRAGLERLATRAGLDCDFLASDGGAEDVAMAEAHARPPILGRDGTPWKPGIVDRALGRLRRLAAAPRTADAPATVKNGTLFAALTARRDR